MLSGAWLASHITTIAPTLEAMLQTKLFPPDIYYLSELPSEVHWSDILGTGLTAFALSILATLYPSLRRVLPAGRDLCRTNRSRRTSGPRRA